MPGIFVTLDKAAFGITMFQPRVHVGWQLRVLGGDLIAGTHGATFGANAAIGGLLRASWYTRDELPLSLRRPR